jgi:hypothetical protein
LCITIIELQGINAQVVILSDKEKFRGDLDRPNSCEMSEWLLKTLQNSGDVQAECEGSIPFTSSSLF